MTTYLTNSLTTGSPTTLAAPYANVGTGSDGAGAFTNLETASVGLRLIGSGVARRALATLPDPGPNLPSGGFTVTATVTATRDAGFNENDAPAVGVRASTGAAVWIDVELTNANMLRLRRLNAGAVEDLSSATSPNFASGASKTGVVGIRLSPGTGGNAGLTRVEVIDVATGGADLLSSPVHLAADYLASGTKLIAGMNRTGTGTTTGGSVANVSATDGSAGVAGVSISGTLPLPFGLSGALTAPAAPTGPSPLLTRRQREAAMSTELRLYADAAPPRLLFSLVQVDGLTPKTGATFPTGDAKYSIDGAAPVNVSVSPVEIGSGLYAWTPSIAALTAKVGTLILLGNAGSYLARTVNYATYGHALAAFPDAAQPAVTIATNGLTAAAAATDFRALLGGTDPYAIRTGDTVAASPTPTASAVTVTFGVAPAAAFTLAAGSQILFAVAGLPSRVGIVTTDTAVSSGAASVALALAGLASAPPAGAAVTMFAGAADPTVIASVDTAAIAEATRASVERTGGPLLDTQTKAGTAATQSTTAATQSTTAATQSTAAATSASTAATAAGLAKTAADTAATAAGTAATSASSAATAAASVDGKLTTARAAKLDTVSVHTPADVRAAVEAVGGTLATAAASAASAATNASTAATQATLAKTAALALPSAGSILSTIKGDPSFAQVLLNHAAGGLTKVDARTVVFQARASDGTLLGTKTITESVDGATVTETEWT